MGEFRMPSLGADMEAGTLVEWLVKPGERVKRGDVIATVETQKGLFEVENFEVGIMGEPLVLPGERVPVGTVLAVIHEEGEPATRAEVTAKAEAPIAGEIGERAAREVPPPPSTPPSFAPTSERIAASPSARKLAAELGVDLGTVTGSGPHGAIQRIDVEQAAQARRQERPADKAPTTTTLREGMRQAIAAAMSRS
ncbi:MAG TPA: E3 binding domain-containing protein, partial [Geobacteraceae bacterium]|nr:E3 binding domain-containing protein [Geobacteraceae bacterium]